MTLFTFSPRSEAHPEWLPCSLVAKPDACSKYIHMCTYVTHIYSWLLMCRYTRIYLMQSSVSSMLPFVTNKNTYILKSYIAASYKHVV